MLSYMCYETGWEDSGTEVKLTSPELSSPSRFPSCSVGKLWPVQTQLKIKPYFLHLHFFCLSLSSPITLENNAKKQSLWTGRPENTKLAFSGSRLDASWFPKQSEDQAAGRVWKRNSVPPWWYPRSKVASERSGSLCWLVLFVCLSARHKPEACRRFLVPGWQRFPPSLTFSP